MGIADSVNKMLSSPSFKVKLRQIQQIAEDDLREAVLETIYSQPEGNWYQRTYTLYNSIKSTDLIVTPNKIEFKVVFDPNILRHTTLLGSKKYGLSPGDEVGSLIIPWLNEGWSWNGEGHLTGLVDNFSFRKPEKFLEKAIEKIKADTIRRVKEAINVEIRKTYGK